MLDLSGMTLPMSKPLTRAQALENRAFLRELRQCGNVREAARRVGVAYGTMQHRRRVHPAFAARWDAALVFAQARLGRAGPLRPAAPSTSPTGGGGSSETHRTVGGEPAVIRLKSGRLQMRRAQPGKLTRACEQAFLLALSATCNIRLAAAAVGAAERAFRRRARRDPGFAREMRMALAQGYERLEMALIAGFAPDSHRDDAWRHNDPPAIPPMTAAQALQLMYLHQKEARLLAEPAHLKRRRGESPEARSYRLSVMYELGQERDREAYRVAEAARRARGEGDDREAPIALPDLGQVTGWSRADPAKGGPKGQWGDRALFGGWRMEDMTEEEREGGRRRG